MDKFPGCGGWDDKRMHKCRVLHIAGYWRGENDPVRLMMDALREIDVDLLEFNTDRNPDAYESEAVPYARGTTGPVWLKREVFDPIISKFDPHIIVCNAGGLSFRPDYAKELRQTRKLLGIAWSDPDVFVKSTSKIATHFDLYLTNAEQCVPDYLALGANIGMKPNATNHRFYRPVATRPEFACDVLVFGSGHLNRVEGVRGLIENFRTHVYGMFWDRVGIPSRGMVFGEESLAVLRSANMVVVFSHTPQGHPIVKPYLFDFAAAGALVLTDRLGIIEPYFRYDEELLGFTDNEDLVSQVRLTLANPNRASKIRSNGYHRVLRDHTWLSAWPRIFAQLNSRCGPDIDIEK